MNLINPGPNPIWFIKENLNLTVRAEQQTRSKIIAIRTYNRPDSGVRYRRWNIDGDSLRCSSERNGCVDGIQLGDGEYRRSGTTDFGEFTA